MFLNSILSKNIILIIMDFKISETNRGKKSLLHIGYIYRIDTLNSTLANGRTMVDSHYHNFSLDSEIL